MTSPETNQEFLLCWKGKLEEKPQATPATCWFTWLFVSSGLCIFCYFKLFWIFRRLFLFPLLCWIPSVSLSVCLLSKQGWWEVPFSVPQPTLACTLPAPKKIPTASFFVLRFQRWPLGTELPVLEMQRKEWREVHPKSFAVLAFHGQVPTHQKYSKVSICSKKRQIKKKHISSIRVQRKIELLFSYLSNMSTVVLQFFPI